MKISFGIFMLWICIISIAFGQKQIDTFNILLPQVFQQNNGKPIELVTTQGGCFQWTSSSPDIVSVQGISSDATNCLRKGIVSLTHVGSYSASIYITATNSETHELSNIPVRIRPIKKIQIIAKSRMMNINQIQDLSVFAYDQEHNHFTSLEGLKFEWELVENLQVLSKISLKNSHLILPLEERKNIERKGAQSDILVIRGVQPGKAIVRVKCIQPGYKTLTHQITVSVHQRFDINPSNPTYLLVDSTFQFGLVTPSRESISIPRSYYKTSISTVNFKVSESLQIKTPLKEDSGILKVEDIRTQPPYFSEVPVYAKIPDQIRLKVDQFVVVGQKANVQVELYWKGHLLKGNYVNKFKIVSELLYDPKTKTIQAKQRTTASVKVVYDNLSVQKKVTVVLPLKAVLPTNRVVLPVDETFELKIIGGSGIYEYHIESDIGSVSHSGVITSKRQGETFITVIDKRVSRNRLIIDLAVSYINTLLPLQNHKQLNVNQFGPIFTIGKSKSYEQYTKCSQQPIMLQISHLPIFQLNNNSTFQNGIQLLNNKINQSSVVKSILTKYSLLPIGYQDFLAKFVTYIRAGDASYEQLKEYAFELQNYGICSVHSLKGYQKYDYHLEVYFKPNLNVRGKFFLRVYEKISNAIEGQTDDYFIMTPLASLLWKTIGGSYDWDFPTRSLVNNVEYYTKYAQVKCSQKETVLSMKIQKMNKQSTQLLLPVNQTKTIYVQCKYPSSLKINYEKQNYEPNAVNGLKGQIIKGKLIPLDDKGQTFYNSSNLIYEHSETAGKLTIQNDNFQYHSLGTASSRVVFWTQRIAGLQNTFAKVLTYFAFSLTEIFELHPHPKNNYLLTLFNPKTSYTFKLTKISQNSEVQCVGAISCVYLSHNEIKVNTTRLGQGKMTIKDKAVYGYSQLVIRFQVVDADQITIETSKTLIQVQKSIQAEVKLFYNKQLITPWQYDFSNLMLVHEAGLRSKQSVGDVKVTSHLMNNHYQITGQKAGIYHVSVEQNYPRYLQSRQPVVLTVYPKIHTNIPSLTETYVPELNLKGEIMVAVNCLRRVSLMGGPQDFKVKSEINNLKNENLIEVKQNDPRELQILGVEQGNTKVKFTVTSIDLKQIIAVIQLTVIIKLIEHASIYSLEQAVINAQFRLLPYLIIDERPLIDSICDLEYKWKADSLLKLRGLNNKRMGINATAIKQGDSTLVLQVINKKGQILFIAQKQITIHKSLNIELPTVIGEHQLAISTNLLIPPNSGYNFNDSNVYITKISQCEDSLLSINQNKLITSREKGMVSVKIQKTNDQQYNNYLNVIVTQIKALFIENSYSHILAQLGKTKSIRFYVQDVYGRLFYNNLFNIEYQVISSNDDIFTVQIDSTKNFIQIIPKKQGQANLILKLKSSETSSSIGKLLEIPHDIVSVEVGKILQPQSPIYIATGGYVDIQYYGQKQQQSWEIIKGKQIVKIDPKTKRITALSPGEATIQVCGFQTTIRVLDPIIKQKVIQKPRAGKINFLAQYIVTGKWQDQEIYFPSISNTYNFVNNNMNLTCDANKNWFISSYRLEKTPNFDKLVCEVVQNQDFDYKLEFPAEFKVSVRKISLPNPGKVYEYTTQDTTPTFWVIKGQRNIKLSPAKNSVQIVVKAHQPFEAEILNGQQSWIKNIYHDASKQVSTIELNVDSASQIKNFQFQVRLFNRKSQQQEFIKVNFIEDENERKAQQKQQSNKEQKPSRQQQRQEQKIIPQPQQGSGLFEQWHWTDFIILIMALNFIGILIYQYCVNGGDKYHVL